MKALCLLILNVSSLYIHLDLMEFMRGGFMQAPFQIVYLWESSQFPNMWKESFVIPLHNKGG